VNITPDILHAAYEYLKVTPPFRGWKLPDADEVEFVVGNSDQCEGYYHEGKWRIEISQKLITRTYSLMEIMAHEMIHFYLERRGVRTHHGAAFKKCAARVCREHGFDAARAF
jgi:predicted SprT family Zn-dependent metalloprotease